MKLNKEKQLLSFIALFLVLLPSVGSSSGPNLVRCDSVRPFLPMLRKAAEETLSLLFENRGQKFDVSTLKMSEISEKNVSPGTITLSVRFVSPSGTKLSLRTFYRDSENDNTYPSESLHFELSGGPEGREYDEEGNKIKNRPWNCSISNSYQFHVYNEATKVDTDLTDYFDSNFFRSKLSSLPMIPRNR